MEDTLVKRSNIVWDKSKFFINRLLIYFAFLLVPIWVQKSLQINILGQSLLMLAYLLFMGGQWYLLGKEIDHRFKIYFRANSSIDRVLYRLIIGNATMMIVFNLMSFIPDSIVRHFFWGFFAIIGLFYSWPTRGKIIEESVSTQFTEYKYLDSFEKTVLFITLAMFLTSMPSFPFMSNLETLKLIVDPDEKMHGQIWNYLHMNFFPFKRFPHLVNLGWSMHFYFINFSINIMRFFISRRLSILGLFALISTWSFSLYLKKDPFLCATTCFSVLWVWSILWCIKSSTYRSGLMYGLLCYVGVVINFNYVFLFPIGLGLLYFFFLKGTTDWYRAQFVKYTMLGMFLILVTMITQIDLRFFESPFKITQLYSHLGLMIKRKSFYALSFLGLFTLLLMIFKPNRKLLTVLAIDVLRLREFSLLVFCILFMGIFVEKDLIHSFGLLWFVVFLSVLPLEWIFQSISRLRSRRNFIYLVYVLVCLLDSHFEGRLRILYNFYQSPPDIVEIINREE